MLLFLIQAKAPSLLLGPIQRFIRSPHQLGSGKALLKNGSAKADGQRAQVPVASTLFKSIPDFPAGLLDLGNRLPPKQKAELVPSKPEGLGLGHCGQNPTQLSEVLIPLLVAICIVDSLEVVQIQNDQHIDGVRNILTHQLKGPLHALPIPDASERIGDSLPHQLHLLHLSADANGILCLLHSNHQHTAHISRC